VCACVLFLCCIFLIDVHVYDSMLMRVDHFKLESGFSIEYVQYWLSVKMFKKMFIFVRFFSSIAPFCLRLGV
jgi:hypothetical protein